MGTAYQEMMFACDLEEVQFFELAGLLPTQMLYLVWLTTGRWEVRNQTGWTYTIYLFHL